MEEPCSIAQYIATCKEPKMDFYELKSISNQTDRCWDIHTICITVVHAKIKIKCITKQYYNCDAWYNTSLWEDLTL